MSRALTSLYPAAIAKKDIRSFEAAAIEARVHSEYDLQRVFDLFDIKVIVHN